MLTHTLRPATVSPAPSTPLQAARSILSASFSNFSNSTSDPATQKRANLFAKISSTLSDNDALTMIKLGKQVVQEIQDMGMGDKVGEFKRKYGIGPGDVDVDVGGQDKKRRRIENDEDVRKGIAGLNVAKAKPAPTMPRAMRDEREKKDNDGDTTMSLPSAPASKSPPELPRTLPWRCIALRRKRVRTRPAFRRRTTIRPG